MFDLGTHYDLRYTLQDAKAEIAFRFITQIILVSAEEGFTLQEILQGLARYVHHCPEYQKAERHLDLAAEAVKKV